MKKPSLWSVFFIVGLLFFFLGLMVLVDQVTLVDSLSQIFPDRPTEELFGATLQFLGGFLVVYGAIKLVSTEFIVQERRNSQAQIAVLSQSIERVNQRTAENANRLASLIVSAQRPSNSRDSESVSSECKFCGASTEEGKSFCPNCGKSQK